MSRLSTVAVSTLVPALNVLSTTLPDSTFLSLVRTKAPPLPGLTCWNSTTDHSWPSRLSTRPFFRSFVVATVSPLAASVVGRSRGPARSLGVVVSSSGSALADDEGVLDADASAAGEVDPGLDGDRRAGSESYRSRRYAEQRRLVDLQADAVARARA